MPYLHNYRIFLSHAWHRTDEYIRIIEFLNRENNFIYSNYSVPEEDAFEEISGSILAEKIKDQIRPTQIVIILSGMYVMYSDWIKFEIDFAKSLRKPILGISPRGAERMPTAVTEAADLIVGWNSASIVNSIRRLVP